MRVTGIGMATVVGMAIMVGCAQPPAPSGPGIQTQGDWWRQIGLFRTQVAYTVRMARDAEELEAELAWHGIGAAPPEWDPEREVIAFFSQGIGGSCPELALSGVTIDREGRLVYAAFVDPLAIASARACTADLVGAQTLIVALARDRLPPTPFTLRLTAQVVGCHPDCGWGPAEIQVDLE